jgi:pimeloyl-ACP methyl ester carboxylesterase
VKPTIVLVHGAFAESASWDNVIDSLESSGHPAVYPREPQEGREARCRAALTERGAAPPYSELKGILK